MAKEEAVKDIGVVITSSPSLIPQASKPVRKASVPEATPTQNLAPQNLAKFFSNSSNYLPRVKSDRLTIRFNLLK